MLDLLTTPLEPFFQQPFFVWLLHTSWQAGILVGLILLVQKALGRRLGVRGRYGLWLVLLARLVLPWAPASSVSVFNFLPPPPWAGYGSAATPRLGNVGPALALTDGTAATGGPGKAGPLARRPGWQAGPVGDARALLFALWLAGASMLTGCIITSHIRLRRIVRHEPAVTDRRILEVLEDCRRLMGAKRVVGVIATDSLDSPALLGFLRPRLLLPRGALAELSQQELRHIFLHEIAHLRRDDIATSYLMTLLHVLHWFNPLVALGLRRMRAEREMVCDALALSVLAPDETAAYGRTIIHQIEQWQMSRPRWVVAALSGDQARVRQRIAMIAQFRQETCRWSPLALVLVGLLACTALTDALTPPPETWDDYVRRDFSTAHQDRHANIVRVCIRNTGTRKYLVTDGDRVTCDADEPGDMGLWEARFDEDLGNPDHVVYFYSVATGKYLTADEQGNVAVNAPYPDETARWVVRTGAGSAWIMPCRFKDTYLRRDEQGQARTVFGKGASRRWEIDQLWRVKTSDDPKSNPQWRRANVPGPD